VTGDESDAARRLLPQATGANVAVWDVMENWGFLTIAPKTIIPNLCHLEDRQRIVQQR
jgi:hypothetical protein